MTRFWMRPPFTREREFIAIRPFRLGGRTFATNDPFDKSLCTTRRLRQLYENNQIRFAPVQLEQELAPVEVETPAVRTKLNSEDEYLRQETEPVPAPVTRNRYRLSPAESV